MKHASLMAAVALLCSVSLSQPAFYCDGYVVSVPAYVRFNDVLASLGNADRQSWMDVNRLRVRPIVNISETGFLTMEYEMAATYRTGIATIIDPPSSRRHQLFDLTWDIQNGDRWHVFHTIDRLYYRQQLGTFDVTLGRQRIAWGSGRIWNPTDLFNPLNPATFSKIEKDGIDAATLKLTLGTLSDFTLVFNPQHDTPSTYALRLRTNVNEFDLVGIGGYFDELAVAGGDIAGNVFDAGIRSEIIFSISQHGPSRRFVKAIVGADYQWTGELYTLIEYHYNGEGETDPTRYALSRLVSGEILNVGREYLAVSASYLIHPLVTGSATWTGNLNDGSMFVALSGVYLPSDEISITLGGQLFVGDLLDEYWYYPASCYAKLEVFF